MGFHGGNQVRRDRNVAYAGVRLGRADDHLSAHPHDCTTDLNAVVLQIEVSASKLCELTEAHGAPKLRRGPSAGTGQEGSSR